MPTTRAARRAAPCLTEVLPADALGLVLYQLTLAHDIAAVAPTCHALDNAAKIALKLRPFSGEVVTLAGHGWCVSCVALAPEGRLITGSFDQYVKMWRDGACVRTTKAHTSYVRAVAVLPGGARYVTGSNDRTAKLWTLDGTLERTFEVGSNVLCAAVLPDGVHFVIGMGYGDAQSRGAVRLYHVDGTLVHTFSWHALVVWSLVVTPDGQHIISGSDDGRVKVWSVADRSLVSTCHGHTNEVNAVAAMPDGQRILSGGDDRTVRVWLIDGTLKNTFRWHTDTVTALVALPDNQHALSGSCYNTIKLSDVDDGAVLRTFRHYAHQVHSLTLLPDGLRFVSGSDDNTARIVYHGLAPEIKCLVPLQLATSPPPTAGSPRRSRSRPGCTAGSSRAGSSSARS